MRKLVAVLMLLVFAGLTATACGGSPVAPAWECPNPTPNGCP